ncbi:hypothetical protein MCOR29_005291 [Pyricularia oryzae]|nr:hypothetical protein MCOR29_005291 [Pyricularia oryzae]KAI6471155.1 hypothetical protein MCOR15_001043 [Pyricularia oryzae]KAI6493210.1 hypothetical protein MCOR11_006292 [Pyricularia oryzae]KAI6533571.1 hypothetical protein MCOR16_003480 [Pyricularia oryzae]
MPPARSTRISDRQWDDVQTRIKQLVHQHVPLSCKDGSRVTIPEILQRENNLDITVSQLEAKLKEWNVAKNLRLREWQVIMPWLDELEDNGTEYQVLLAGKEIKKTAIRRARRRLKQKSHDDALLGSTVPIIETREISIKIREHDSWIPFRRIAAPMGANAALDEVGTGNQEQNRDPRTPIPDTSLSAPNNQPTTSPSHTRTKNSQLVLRSASTTQASVYAAPESGRTPLSDLFQAALLDPQDQSAGGDDYFSLDQPLSIGPVSPGFGIFDPWANILSPAQGTFDFWTDLEGIHVVQQSPLTTPLTTATAALTRYTQMSASILPTEMPANSYDLLRGMLQHAADARMSAIPDEDSLSEDESDDESEDDDPEQLPALPEVDELCDRLLGLTPREEVDNTFGCADEVTNPGSTIRMALVHSIINNFAGLRGLPAKSILWALKNDVKLRSALFRRLHESSAALAKTVTNNLFRAAVVARDAETAKLIIEAGKGRTYAICLEEVICTFQSFDYTPLQLAARLRDPDMTQMLLDLGADPNKVAPGQNKSLENQKTPVYLAAAYARQPSSGATRQTTLILLRHGAIITPEFLILFLARYRRPSNHDIPLEAGYLTQLIRSLPAIDHRQCFDRTLSVSSSGPIISALVELVNGPECTAVFQLLMDKCIEAGCQRCTVDFAKTFEQTMEYAAICGNLELCELHLRQGFPITIGVFCSAIRSRNNQVIELCLRHQFIAITPPTHLAFESWIPDLPRTTPLAEAVYAQNNQLAKIFEGLGAWSLVETCKDHFAALISAAAAVGDLRSLKRALGLRAHTNSVMSHNALMEAIRNKQTEATLILLDEGVKPSEEHLLEALMIRNKEIVDTILDSDIRFTDRRHSDHRAMEEAGKWGDISVIKNLTFMGFNLNYGHETTVLIEAVKLKNKELVIFLLNSGANPNIQPAFGNTCSPLGEAIGIESEEMVDLLLSKGANPANEKAFLNATRTGHPCLGRLLGTFRETYPLGLPGFGMESLIKAMRNNEVDVLRSLLLAGFDPNSLGTDLATPLGFAIHESANIEFVVQLLDSGADVGRVAIIHGSSFSEHSDSESHLYPALLVAVNSGRDAIANLLLDRGADVNQPARLGVKRTPLQAACEIGSWKMVRLLLQRGADVGAPPARSGGGTALQMAAKEGHVRVVQLLLSLGATVHEVPSRVLGRSALEGAAENGRLRMLGVLWTAGQSASGGFPDEEIMSAIKYANQKGHKGCADYLAWLWATQSAATRGISEEVHDSGTEESHGDQGRG